MVLVPQDGERPMLLDNIAVRPQVPEIRLRQGPDVRAEHIARMQAKNG